MESEVFSRNQIEATLFEQEFSILQEMGSLVLYQKNVFPPMDMLLDWSRDSYEWHDLQPQLEYQGVNTKNFYELLNKH